MAIQEASELSSNILRCPSSEPWLGEHYGNPSEIVPAIEDLQCFHRQLSSHILAAGADITAWYAQHALATHQFYRRLSWPADHVLIENCVATIQHFQSLGHTSIAHILHIRLLQAGVTLDEAEMEVVHHCWERFMNSATRYICDTQIEIPSRMRSCQIFTPRELLRIPKIASKITADTRFDLLGRTGFHILADAGIAVQWPRLQVNQADLLGRTALHQALCQRDAAAVCQIIYQGANLKLLCPNGISALHIAGCRGQVKIVKWLAQSLPELVDKPDASGRSPFWYATKSSHLGVMKLLATTYGVNIAQRDSYGHSAFAAAANDGRIDVLGYLLKTDSDRQKRPGSVSIATPHLIDHTPLLLASKNGNQDCVTLILEHRSWKAGDNEFDNVKNLAEQHGDSYLLERLDLLWTVDARKGFQPAQKPWPNCREMQQPGPSTVYMADFNTNTWNEWHLGHAQATAKEGFLSPTTHTTRVRSS
ncbi:hypothetical protein SVAN01_07466 [Stagonosporopsis vannaccii]|nr:hypothetical protein SVAN01_07466 [Stagonosporopsis vannaccii]